MNFLDLQGREQSLKKRPVPAENYPRQSAIRLRERGFSLKIPAGMNIEYFMMEFLINESAPPSVRRFDHDDFAVPAQAALYFPQAPYGRMQMMKHIEHEECVHTVIL